MTRRWASIAGCTIRVVCIGAVATYEEYRGKGLATQLLELACKEAIDDGVDFMLISGGRGMYRRAGAADVGADCRAALTPELAGSLRTGDVSVRDFVDTDLPDCVAAYRKKTTHFIRPADDWEGLLRNRCCACKDIDLAVVERGGCFSGYMVLGKPDKDGESAVVEFAGEESALAAALGPALERYGAARIRLHLQDSNAFLKAAFERAGAAFEPAKSPGTLLVLNFPQLTRRLRPFIQEQVGIACERALSFEEQDGKYSFSDGQETCFVDGKMAAAEFLFGQSEARPTSGPLAKAFPVPTLIYGVNYI